MCSEAFIRNGEFSVDELVDLHIMGLILYRSQRRLMHLWESDSPITAADIASTDPSDEEAAELERIADWIIKRCEEGRGAHLLSNSRVKSRVEYMKLEEIRALLENNQVETMEAAFGVGYNTALMFVAGNPIIVDGKVVGTADVDLLKLFRGLNVRQRHKLMCVALDIADEGIEKEEDGYGR